MLDSELNLPLGVHDGVRGVEQDLLHVGEPLDLLLQLLVAHVHPLEQTLGHAAGLHDDLLQVLRGVQDVLLRGHQRLPQALLAAHVLLLDQDVLDVPEHAPGVVAHVVHRLPRVVDVGGQQADDVV